MRTTIEIREALAILDTRLAVVRDKRRYLQKHRLPNETPELRRRKYIELLWERCLLLGIRRKLSSLRYA